MIVVMSHNSTQEQLALVKERIESRGLRAQLSTGVERTVVGVLGGIPSEFKDEMELLPGVAEVVLISKPYKLASREFHPDASVVRVGNGGNRRPGPGHHGRPLLRGRTRTK